MPFFFALSPPLPPSRRSRRGRRNYIFGFSIKTEKRVNAIKMSIKIVENALIIELQILMGCSDFPRYCGVGEGFARHVCSNFVGIDSDNIVLA
jgi:hypothetical protein